MYGLYDTDGILRFFCSDREACLAYAELFDLRSMEYFLMALPDPLKQDQTLTTNHFQKRRRVMSNN